MKLLIMRSSPASRHFLPHRSKYSPQHPVFRHPQTMFFPLCELVSHIYKTTGKMQFCVFKNNALEYTITGRSY